jgi:esterase/lipase superfamily enzyme
MRAKAAGITVVAVDVGAEGGVDATVISNEKQAGALDGKYVVDRLKGKGQIVIVNGPPVTPVSDRVAGFLEVIKDYPDIKILSQDQNAGGSRDGGLRVMTDLLTAFPQIDAVFATNDPTAIGCDLAAKQAQRKDFFIVGVDGAPDVVSSIKDPNNLIAASAAQDPYTLGREAVTIGYEIIEGKKPQQNLVLVPVDFVTKENIDHYKGWNNVRDGSRQVTVIYATNRVPHGGGGAEGKCPHFYYERSRTLTFGSAIVHVSKDHSPGRRERSGTQWYSFLPIIALPTPEHDFVLRDCSVLTEEQILQLIRTNQPSSALVFVHGFGTPFEDALLKLAQITFDTDYPGLPIAFSWPSKEKIDPARHPFKALLAYNYDRESARYSQDSFLQLLRFLRESAHITNIFVVAHSMGTQIVVNALDQARCEGEKPSLSEVVLADPDVDSDVLKLSARWLTDAAKGVTLYASSSDKALLISTRWNGNARAGFIPTTGPLVLPGIDTIDVTSLGKDIFAINHDTPFYEALDDIASLLKDAKHPPNGRSNRMLEVTEKISHLHYWRYSPESRSH